MLYVTSFNYGMYLTKFQNLLTSFRRRKIENVELLVYHEASHEGVDPSKMELSGIEVRDVFLARPELNDVVAYPHYETAFLETGKWSSMNYHSQFFARKVFSIYDAAIKNTTHDILCWVDCDSVFRNSNHHLIYDLKMENDICYRNRSTKDKPSETGFIVFDLTNPLVMEFIKKWRDIYITQEVFNLECWADHCAFDYVVTLFPNLKYTNLYETKANKLIKHCIGHKSQNVLREKSFDFFKTKEQDFVKAECALYKKLSLVRERRRDMANSMAMLGQNDKDSKSVIANFGIGDIGVENPIALINKCLKQQIEDLQAKIIRMFFTSLGKPDDEKFWNIYRQITSEIDLLERLKNNLKIENLNYREGEKSDTIDENELEDLNGHSDD